MTSDAVNPRKRDNSDEGRLLSPEQAAAAAMVAEARQRGLELTGPDGLLKLFTKNVLETALNEELTEHLGYEKHQAGPGRQRGMCERRPFQDGYLRCCGRGPHRCSPRPGRDVRAADREEEAAAAHRCG